MPNPQSSAIVVPRPKAQLNALTGTRFLAAAAVLLSHFSETGLVDIPHSITDFLDGGRTAVAYFFVLSGFVLTHQYSDLRSKAEARKFWINRLARIFPLLLLALFVSTIPTAYAYVHRDQGYLLDWYSLDSHIKASLAISFIAQMFGATGWLPIASFNQPWNGPAWSISCELFFYALFPLLISWLRRLRLQILCGIYVAGFVLQGALLLVIKEYAPEGRRGFLQSQFPITHLYEFIAGIICCLVFTRPAVRASLDSLALRIAMLLASLGAITAISIVQPLNPVYYLMGPILGLLIIGLAATSPQNILGSAPLVLLGLSSYALYILHIPLIRSLQMLGLSGQLAWLSLILCIAISIGAHRWIETPAREWIRRSVLSQRLSSARTPGDKRTSTALENDTAKD